MTGDVDNPMLSRSLLFIMSLVLRCGIRIVYDRSSDAAVVHIIMNPRIGGIFGIEGSYHSTTMVDPETRMARIHYIRHPDLAVICLPVSLLGTHFFWLPLLEEELVLPEPCELPEFCLDREESPLLSDFDESEDLLSSFLESSDCSSLLSDSFFSSVLVPEVCVAFSSLGFFLSLFFTAVAALSVEPLPCFATLAHPS